MARSGVAAGHHVTILARWEPGLPLEESVDGYRVVRVPSDVRLAVPGFRAGGRRRIAARLAHEAAAAPVRAAGDPDTTDPPTPPAPPTARARRAARARRRRGDLIRRATRGTRLYPLLQSTRGFVIPPRRLVTFPLRPMAWAVALEEVAQPADIWHGMWAGSLPALGRLRRRHGGATIYDSRDVYLHARAFDRMGPAWRRLYLGLERRWAKSADAVLTVNDAYAEILERVLRIARPAVVMNCPERWTPPDPPRPHPRALSSPPDRDRPLPGQPHDRAGHRGIDGGHPRRAGRRAGPARLWRIARRVRGDGRPAALPRSGVTSCRRCRRPSSWPGPPRRTCW